MGISFEIIIVVFLVENVAEFVVTYFVVHVT